MIVRAFNATMVIALSRKDAAIVEMTVKVEKTKKIAMKVV